MENENIKNVYIVDMSDVNKREAFFANASIKAKNIRTNNYHSFTTVERKFDYSNAFNALEREMKRLGIAV